MNDEKIIEINDLELRHGYRKSIDDIQRCKLASVCRLLAKYNFAYSVYNHVTVRISDESILINPFGLDYDEVTASSLIEIDMDGNFKNPGSTQYGINQTAFVLHSAIHEARPDINCVIHVHTHFATAVSATKTGLLPICQEAMLEFDNISYCEYDGILTEEKHRNTIAKSLGIKNKLMFLRNHGIVACGETVEVAWFHLFQCIYACRTQLAALTLVGGDISRLHFPNEQEVDKLKRNSEATLVNLHLGSKVAWNYGEMEFEAEMRRFDRFGAKTGYPYKMKAK